MAGRAKPKRILRRKLGEPPDPLPNATAVDDLDKIQVVTMVMLGHSDRFIATQLGVERETAKAYRAHVKRWTKELTDQTRDGLGLAILRTVLLTLNAQQVILQTISDPRYIKSQPSNELAVLYGVIADKGFRILEALAPETDEAAGE